jgi:hypothetical protein
MKVTFGLLACFFLPFSSLHAEKAVFIPKGSYALSIAHRGKTNADQAMPFVARVLGSGGRLLLALPKGVHALKDGAALSQEALAGLLSHAGPYYFLQQDAAAVEAARTAYPDVQMELIGEDVGPRVVCQIKSLPRIGSIENVSTIRPLSEGLKQSRWPCQVVDFTSVDTDPAASVDAGRFDFLCFSSPGWWQNFANDPSGPSRMQDKTVRALRQFVSRGGTAYFYDISQWDLEKAWPGSLKMEVLGPTGRGRTFHAAGPNKPVQLTLAGEGTAAREVTQTDAITAFSSEKFPYPEGKPRPAVAAYAFKDPNGGSGVVWGQAFYTYDQDEAGGTVSRNFLMNLLLVSNPSRVTAWDGLEKPQKLFTPTYTETPLPAVPPTKTADPTATTVKSGEAPTEVPTSVPTEVPATATEVPTQPPTPAPTATEVPTQPPTIVPTEVPTEVPTQAPSPKPTVVLSRGSAKILGCLQAAPLPFSTGGVFIYFCLAQDATVRLSLFDAKGKLVRVIKVHKETAGRNKQWFYDGRDKDGGELAPGAYYYSLEAWGADGGREQRFDKITKE